MVKVITNHGGVIQGLSVAPSMFNIMFHTFIWDWKRQTHMHQAIKTGDFSLYPDDFVKRNPNPPPCRRRNSLTPTSHCTPWSRSRPIMRRRGGPPSRYAMSSGRVWKEGHCLNQAVVNSSKMFGMFSNQRSPNRITQRKGCFN